MSQETKNEQLKEFEEQMLKKVKEYINENKIYNALMELMESVKDYPESVTLHMLLAEVSYLSDMNERAVTECKKVLELDANNKDAKELLEKIKQEEKKKEEEKKKLEEEEKKKKEEERKKEEIDVGRYREPVSLSLIFFISLIPGGGNFFFNKTVSGIIIFLIVPLSFLLLGEKAILGNTPITDFINKILNEPNINDFIINTLEMEETRVATLIKYGIIGIGILIYLISIVSSLSFASKYNIIGYIKRIINLDEIIISVGKKHGIKPYMNLQVIKPSMSSLSLANVIGFIEVHEVEQEFSIGKFIFEPGSPERPNQGYIVKVV